MKISNKISGFILFLLAVLAANTLVGLSQLEKISSELNAVVNQDIKLTECVGTIAQRQFEKAILFERVIRAAEEIGFENVSKSREINW